VKNERRVTHLRCVIPTALWPVPRVRSEHLYDTATNINQSISQSGYIQGGWREQNKQAEML